MPSVHSSPPHWVSGFLQCQRAAGRQQREQGRVWPRMRCTLGRRDQTHTAAWLGGNKVETGLGLGGRFVFMCGLLQPQQQMRDADASQDAGARGDTFEQTGPFEELEHMRCGQREACHGGTAVNRDPSFCSREARACRDVAKARVVCGSLPGPG